MSVFRFPWDEVPAAPPTRGKPAVPKRPRGRPKASAQPSIPVAPPGGRAAAPRAEDGIVHTEWLPFRLTAAGAAAELESFAAAARGSGITPWRIDFAAMEEDLFHRLAARYPRSGRLSLEGCRVFAAQLRERTQDRRRRDLDAAAGSRACPFDLHALLPVPASVLLFGPDHPEAKRWLRNHWGTGELRRVELLPSTPGRQAKDQAELRLSFFAADAGPAAAVRRLGRVWPGLQLNLRPASGG
ncbi:hypothetical protein WDZ11_22465 (plasmid) [Roseomonas mucosa]|uniref:hypothetical protein n=1 Tax=Roseomonas mucosa TaxID=207340 RepID=UPI0030D03F57